MENPDYLCSVCKTPSEFEFQAHPCNHCACALCHFAAARDRLACAACGQSVQTFESRAARTWTNRRSLLHDWGISFLKRYPKSARRLSILRTTSEDITQGETGGITTEGEKAKKGGSD